MNCPIDQTPLAISDRQGIEIDYCPTCRGVWLDRGELDKLIERSTASAPAAPPPHHQPERRHEEPRESYRPQERRYEDGHHGSPHKKHKKESFLGDLFDF